MKKLLSIALLIIFVVLIEAAALSNWYLLPATPDIMLIVLLYISMHNGPIVGQVTGFSSGLLIDFLSSSPFGLNALIRTILGFISGVMHLNLHSKGVFIPVLVAFIATLSKALLLFLVSFFYPEKIALYSLFTSQLWYECIFNALLSPIIFYVLSMFKILTSSASWSLRNE